MSSSSAAAAGPGVAARHQIVEGSGSVIALSKTKAQVPLASSGTKTAATAAPANACTTFQEAMLNVPYEQKAAYLEALEKDPDLVQRESDPSRFLECERNDPWKAAKRLAFYWEQRKDIFGADRAFLPLNQTGTGALNEQDLEILNTAALVVLPNNSKGQSVISADPTRFLPEHSFPHYFASKLRMVFYILSIIAENKETQTTGIMYLSLLATAPDSELSRRSMILIHDAIPIWTMETHIIFLPSRAVYRSYFDKIMDHCIDLLSYFAPTASFHRGKTDQEVLGTLIKSHGIAKRGIPQWMSGSWTMENFHNWQKRRVRMEQTMLMTEEEKLQRKRQANAVHSRQKRERCKSQVAMLQAQYTRLQAEKERLVAENRQLEQHLEYARSEAAILEYLEQQQMPRQPQQPPQQPQAYSTTSAHASMSAASTISSVGQMRAVPSANGTAARTDDYMLWNFFDSDPF